MWQMGSFLRTQLPVFKVLTHIGWGYVIISTSHLYFYLYRVYLVYFSVKEVDVVQSIYLPTYQNLSLSSNYHHQFCIYRILPVCIFWQHQRKHTKVTKLACKLQHEIFPTSHLHNITSSKPICLVSTTLPNECDRTKDQAPLQTSQTWAQHCSLQIILSNIKNPLDTGNGRDFSLKRDQNPRNTGFLFCLYVHICLVAWSFEIGEDWQCQYTGSVCLCGSLHPPGHYW